MFSRMLLWSGIARNCKLLFSLINPKKCCCCLTQEQESRAGAAAFSSTGEKWCQSLGLCRNLSGLPSTLTSIFRSCCVSFSGGRGVEGKELLSPADWLKPQWNDFPCSVTYSASPSVPQTGPRGAQRCPGAGDHLHLAADTGSELLEAF